MHEVQFVEVILQVKQLVSHNVHNGLVASVPSLNLPIGHSNKHYSFEFKYLGILHFKQV